jgi:predicted ribosomally synthesized peptide with nif11-like leader
MSVESARAFYQKFNADEAFRSHLQSVAEEERTIVIQEAGYDFTPEEWNVVIAQVSEAIQRIDELDEAELEAVSGGSIITPIAAAYGTGLPLNLDWPFLKKS